MPEADAVEVGKIAASSHLDRCNLLLLDHEDKAQGTGVLWRPGWLLTCAHVVGEVGQHVSICDGSSQEPLTRGIVRRRGNPWGPDDLAWVELDAPLDGRAGLGGVVIWTPGEEFIVSGFPSHGRDHVSGNVHGQSRTTPAWFTIDARSNRRIEPGFSGAAVWSVEKQAMIGVVVQYESDGITHVIPKPIIDDFLPRPPLGNATPDVPNVGGNRWVWIEQPKTGVRLGSGFRLTERWVLTARSVVAEASDVAVAEPPRFATKSARWVWPEGGDSEPLVLLETEPVVGPTNVPEISGQPGRAWRTAGYRLDVASTADRLGFQGWLSGGDDSPWRLAEGGQRLGEDDLLAGSAVFVADDVPDAGPWAWTWRLAGILDRVSNQGEPVHWVVHPLRSLIYWSGLATRPQPMATEVDSRTRLDIRRLLQRPGVRDVVVEQDLGWRRVAEGGTASEQGCDRLADTLCEKTDPEVLALRLSEAYCRQLSQRQQQVAHDLYELLMTALPEAMRWQWHLAIPEGASAEVKLALVDRALAEFAMAASDGGAARFCETPNPGSDLPESAYAVPRPGEFGYDPGREDDAAELAEDLMTRLALQDDNQGRFIARLATRRGPGGGPRLISSARLNLLGPKPADGAQQNDLLQMLNHGLSRGTAGGRRLYLIAKTAEDALSTAMRSLLPELRIVYLRRSDEAADEDAMKLYDLLLSLETIFIERHRLKESNP